MKAMNGLYAFKVSQSDHHLKSKLKETGGTLETMVLGITLGIKNLPLLQHQCGISKRQGPAKLNSSPLRGAGCECSGCLLHFWDSQEESQPERRYSEKFPLSSHPSPWLLFWSNLFSLPPILSLPMSHVDEPFYARIRLFFLASPRNPTVCHQCYVHPKEK